DVRVAVLLERPLEEPLRFSSGIADDDHTPAGRPLDLGGVAALALAMLEENRLLATNVVERPADVVCVRVLRDESQGHLLATTADEDRQSRLDRWRRIQCAGRVIAAPGGGRLLAVEHAAHDGQRFAEPAQPFRGVLAERETEGAVLCL